MTIISSDTAKGMAYLESETVVHKDLAARNVLIAENGDAKVCDFGLAHDIRPKTAMDEKLPIKWTAPEALRKCVCIIYRILLTRLIVILHKFYINI